MPENYFMRVVLPTWARHKNIDAKTITRRVLGTDLVPDLAYCINGFWLDRDLRPLATSKLKDCLFADADAVFVKADRGARGEGVRKVTRDQFDLDHLLRLGDVVVQSAIEQHPFFDRFTPDCVATLRITTVKPPGRSAEHRGSFFCFGLGDATSFRHFVRVPVIDDANV